MLESFTVAIIWLTAACLTTPYEPPVRDTEVEIAPGSFVTVARQDWSLDDPENRSGESKSRLMISYGGKIVAWEGISIPITLREHDGRLYMIGWDRETGRRAAMKTGAPRWKISNRYYRQDGQNFAEIKAGEFPGGIATQNLRLGNDAAVDVALRMDTTDPDFRMLPIADVWREIVTGKPPTDDFPDKDTLDEFVRRYKPTKRTAIRRPVTTTKAKGETPIPSRGPLDD